ncbi:alpha/beta fold hydrolase [Streptomyces sp. NPDC059002]|uniref:alpha/beta fold hydrolase n=1 Tax=Streptomyces sp. NPDC059002 TaxID=3346690 RepID=UPI00367669D3
MDRDRVISRDGTPIAYTRAGAGPVLVLVGGGLDDGAENAPLVPELAGDFTVLNYARRGRGASGDTPPYALEREFDDLAALIAGAGGTAHLYGVSSGGALALEAAAAGVGGIDRIAVYEVPYNLRADWPPRWLRYRDELAEELGQGRLDAAFAAFLRVTGTPEQEIRAFLDSPAWPGLRDLVPSLAHDAACLGDGRPPVQRLARITRPVLVLTGGGHGPDAPEWVVGLDAAADAIAAGLAHADRLTLAGQTHVADPKAVADVLRRFLAG